jgi:hypothetical protein
MPVRFWRKWAVDEKAVVAYSWLQHLPHRKRPSATDPRAEPGTGTGKAQVSSFSYAGLCSNQAVGNGLIRDIDKTRPAKHLVDTPEVFPCAIIDEHGGYKDSSPAVPY